ncbi:MAG: HEAT repeat domain-containing protein, partial [Candidatus Hodarchaeota archaeon]
MNVINKYIKELAESQSRYLYSNKVRAITGIVSWANNFFRIPIEQRREVMSLLIKSLNDSNRKVKNVAAWALGVLG